MSPSRRRTASRLARLIGIGVLLAACKIAPGAGEGGREAELDEATATKLMGDLRFDGAKQSLEGLPTPAGSGAPEVRNVSEPPQLTPGLEGSVTVWLGDLPTTGSFTLLVSLEGAKKRAELTLDAQQTEGKTSGGIALPFRVDDAACEGLEPALYRGSLVVAAAVGAGNVGAAAGAPVALDCRDRPGASGAAGGDGAGGPSTSGCETLKPCSRGGSLRACSIDGACWYEIGGQRLDCGACDGTTLALCAQIASADCNGP